MLLESSLNFMEGFKFFEFVGKVYISIWHLNMERLAEFFLLTKRLLIICILQEELQQIKIVEEYSKAQKFGIMDQKRLTMTKI